MKKYLLAVFMSLGLMFTAACQSKTSSSTTTCGVVQVVAAENFWGSIAAQVGGSHVMLSASSPTPTPTRIPTSRHHRTPERLRMRNTSFTMELDMMHGWINYWLIRQQAGKNSM